MPSSGMPAELWENHHGILVPGWLCITKRKAIQNASRRSATVPHYILSPPDPSLTKARRSPFPKRKKPRRSGA